MNEFLLCFLICLFLYPIILHAYRVISKADGEKSKERKEWNRKLINEEKEEAE